MSYHILPLIFFNLGGEMFYVLDQRLKAQKVAPDKARRVLDEIGVLMLNQKFLEELFKPQKIYNKQALFALFRDIAHASIMKLSNTSMGKLYDLMIMVFKYQIFSATHPADILLITLNHLDSLRHLLTSTLAHRQLNITYFQLSKVYFPMSNSELQQIRYEILNFFQDVRTKVSIFLRKGQQNVDGTFVIPLDNVLQHGMEIPGISKLWNEDGSLRDIITFSAGGEYTILTQRPNLDLTGNRVIELGTSIYNEISSNHDSFWWECDQPVPTKWNSVKTNTTYRDELNTLMIELLGAHKKDAGEPIEDEILKLDLFDQDIGDENARNKAETKSSSNNGTIPTEIDATNQQSSNSFLQSIANEMEQTVTEIGSSTQHTPDLLQLLQSLDNDQE